MAYQIKDQTRQGESQKGDDAGEVDIQICVDGFPIVMIEALVLDSLKKQYLGDHINKVLTKYIATLGLDYSKMTEAQQYELGAYVNLMNASTQLLINPIKDLSPKFSMTDLDGFMAWKDRKTDKSIYEDNKDFIVSLANLLYKIELDDREKKLLWKSLRKNKKMLKSMDISKKEFDMDLMNGILDALRYKYIQNEKLV